MSNKVSIPALAGAVITVLFWVLSMFDIKPPPEVAAASTLLVMFGLGYLVPHGGDKDT